jgi:hypothetical protein
VGRSRLKTTAWEGRRVASGFPVSQSSSDDFTIVAGEFHSPAVALGTACDFAVALGNTRSFEQIATSLPARDGKGAARQHGSREVVKPLSTPDEVGLRLVIRSTCMLGGVLDFDLSAPYQYHQGCAAVHLRSHSWSRLLFRLRAARPTCSPGVPQRRHGLGGQVHVRIWRPRSDTLTPATAAPHRIAMTVRPHGEEIARRRIWMLSGREI